MPLNPRALHLLAGGLLSTLLLTAEPPPITIPPVPRGGSEVDQFMIDIPQAWRRKNWAPYGEGSCVHATMVMLCHWQGQHALADWWEAAHHSGETADGLASKLESAGVRFAETRAGDVQFLAWATRTVRGCGVVVRAGRHMVLLAHLDGRCAGLLDNNNPGVIAWRDREDFIAEWRAAGGWAVTPVYTPPAPVPHP